MNVVISIEHPAWAHQFLYIIKELEARGDSVTVLAVDKDGCLDLLDRFGIEYKLMANSTGKNTIEKAWLFLKLCITYTLACKRARADILIGRLSPMMSVAAFLTRRPHVLYDDSEVCVFGFSLARLFSTKLIVPRAMLGSQGKKEVRIPMYKEMYYLDPKHFTPDKEIVQAAGINPDEKFVLVRFVAWKASHDFGKTGLTDKQKIDFIRKLSNYAKVYISSEKKLPEELEPYRIKIPYDKIHHVMYYAQLVISDGATMASEAVVLGTHAIRLCPIKCGTFIEQENRYHLLKWFPGATPEWFEKGLEEAVKMLKQENLWEEGKKKREKILEEIGDCNQFFIDVMDDVMKSNKRSGGGQNVVISIEHPAWAHQFHYIIQELEARGDKVTVLAIDKDGSLDLLNSFGIPYKRMANTTGRNVFEKAWLFLKLCISYTLACKRAKADILIGRLSPMMSVAAFLTGSPHVLYEDSDACTFGFLLARLFSTKIIVPRPLFKSQGKKEIRIPMYKEMYYLDPKHFTPDKEIVREAGINPDEKYVLVRFVAWKASHDFGKTGMTNQQKLDFIEKLSKYAKVYISSENELPPELEPYRVKVPFDKIHHVLYFATLIISDGTTMASEAVVLGTHALCLNGIKCGTILEQERKYQLLKWYPGAGAEWFDEGLKQAVAMLQ